MKGASATSATTQISRPASCACAAPFPASRLVKVAPEADIAEMVVATRAASVWLDVVAFVRKVVNYALSTPRALLPLIQKALCCRVHLCALKLTARQSLVPFHLAVDAEAPAALAVAAADSLPVQLGLTFRDNNGAAAGARRHIPDCLSQVELQELGLVTCNCRGTLRLSFLAELVVGSVFQD